jgi:Phosphotransferase enzyme family
VAGGRRFLRVEDLVPVARAAFPRRGVVGLRRLRGGSKKGVYRLVFDDGSTAVVYVWDPAENYWPAPPGAGDADPGDPFSAASGLDLFRASHDALTAAGVATPRIYLADDSRTWLAGDIAVVQDVSGPSLEAALRGEPTAARRALAQVADALAAMARHRGPAYGKVAVLARGPAPRRPPIEQVVLDRALTDLAEAASRVEPLAAARDRLAATAYDLAAAVEPRTDYALIHGELGPDHILLDSVGRPLLVDIEGAMFFDLEWEHAFLRMRFHEHYDRLRIPDLDQPRLRLYTLALHLSLVAGPLRLLAGDFPDRQAMTEIINHNITRTLDHLP